ncbi:MAG: hypothetical protein K2Q09_04770, partial [Phycisphaerales bacterium]|nr:hypothetical protein [Phycisphaerales bacterium]
MPPSDRQREQGFDAFRRGDFSAARRLLSPAAMAGHPDAALYAAESAFRLGEGPAARFFIDRLLAGAQPEDSHMAGAAVVLIKMGDTQTAERLLLRAAADHPGWLSVRLELVALYLMTARAHLAGPVVEQMRAAGADADLLERLTADVLRAEGDVEGARALYERCLERTPGDAAAAELAAYLTNLSAVATAREGFMAHARFGRVLERSVARLPERRAEGPERRLRVAFVCDNFAAHSVAHFLTAPLRHLERDGFEVWGVSTNAIEDAVTARLSAMCDRFVRLPGVSAHDLAARLRADRVDAAIDLNGLTAGNRLAAFAARPTPLSVTWLAYPSTTGLSSIDLRIVDSVTDPPGTGADEGEGALTTERPARLDPCFVCFTPLYDPDAERIAAAPPKRPVRDHVVFGCFNNAAKITDDALAVWARVLGAVPGSRLLIKGRGLASQRARDALGARAAAAGIDPARLDVLPEAATVSEHLLAYRLIDVQFD